MGKFTCGLFFIFRVKLNIKKFHQLYFLKQKTRVAYYKTGAHVKVVDIM